MSKLLVFMFVFAFQQAFSQQTWKAAWNMAIDEESTWDADQAGNIYLFNKESISKLDTSGRQLLTQSAKSIGTIEKIDATNWLKIAVFSEEQQQVCYLDNALGVQPGCIQLTEMGITLAQNFATSVQTDRIWVYDQLNSELQLVTLRNSQRQIVQNLRSLLDIGTVTQLFEYNNVLYLVDNLGQLAQFDNFGTFMSGTMLSAQYVQAFSKGLLYSSAGTIFARSVAGEEETVFFTFDSKEPIRQFRFVGKHLYLSTASGLYCFRLVP